jgi:hypothetical protein
VAASFVLVLAMGRVELHASRDNQARRAPSASCNEVASAGRGPEHEVGRARLRQQPTAHAQVLVKGNQAYLVVDGLAENNVANRVYVLWKAGADNHMKGVRGFDVVHDGPTSSRSPTRRRQRDKQFAVSIEQGRKIPAPQRRGRRGRRSARLTRAATRHGSMCR